MKKSNLHMPVDETDYIVSVAVFASKVKCFDYLLPRALMVQATSGVIWGRRVLINLRNRLCLGFVLGKVNSVFPPERLKPILFWVDQVPILPLDTLVLLEWATRYYFYPFAQAAMEILPSPLSPILGKPSDQKSLWSVRNPDPAPENRAELQLCRYPLKAFLDPNEAGDTKLPRMRVLRWLKVDASTAPRLPSDHMPLTPEQQSAVTKILEGTSAGSNKTILLNGVTGSGKTRVYVEVIRQLMVREGNFLVLVPEIGLIRPMYEAFSDLETTVACWHSAAADSEKLRIWQGVYQGSIRLVIGTRSAIWLPFQKLSGVVVDEEHDSAYKQQRAFRYHARDVAGYLMKQNRGLLVLGSATPSFETLFNVKKGKFQEVSLSHRVGNRRIPKEYILGNTHFRSKGEFSETLKQRIKAHLENEHSVLMILNKRGYALKLYCLRCEKSLTCLACDRPVVFHQKERQLRCPTCQVFMDYQSACPDCLGGLTELGIGTERLEEHLKAWFPTYSVYRCDRDTVKQGQLGLKLAEFELGTRPSILVGTQMLSKGHDFSKVSMVFLLGGDQALYSSDLRAEERFAQLYTQVQGRAGRHDTASEMIVQSDCTGHPLLQHLQTGGYGACAEFLMKERRATHSFPYARWIFIWAEHPRSTVAEEFLRALSALLPAERLGETKSDLQVVGPLADLVPKQGGYFRWALQLGHSQPGILHRVVRTMLEQSTQIPVLSRLRWWIDVDPIQGG